MPFSFLEDLNVLEDRKSTRLNFSNWFYSAVTIIGMVASVYFLAVAMRTIPLGTAYAIWTGIGCIGAFIAGILLFGEAFTVSRTVFASLIAIGIIGLKFSAS